MGGSLYGNESLKADAMARVGGHNLLTCLAACGAAIVAAAPVVSVGQERGAVDEPGARDLRAVEADGPACAEQAEVDPVAAADRHVEIAGPGPGR